MSPYHWKNWSGLVECHPAVMEAPESVPAVVRMVKECAQRGGKLRVAGSGHSFTELVKTSDTLLSLDGLSGLEEVDGQKARATVLAGTRLWMLNELLDEQGLAMENLGDINQQSLAGAISTGTHGTGMRLGSLSTQACALTLVTATGEVLECSEEENTDIYKAALVSLGALGVIVKVCLRLLPSYRLRYVRQRASLEACLENLANYRDRHRHFEFFFFPHTETVQLKFLDETQEPASGRKKRNIGKFLPVALENAVFGLMSRACRWFPVLCKPASRMAAKMAPEGEKVDLAHQVLSTVRRVRFQEMEYALPAGRAADALQEIKQWISAHNIAVHFPIECRFVREDDIYLSPSYGRDSAYIAVHMYQGMEFRRYFEGVESIFRNHQGRPHWGKLHTLTGRQFSELYPMWERFHQIRRRLDPQGIFLNSYLEGLFR